MKKTGKTRRTRWLSCMVTLSLCLGSLGAAERRQPKRSQNYPPAVTP